MGSLVGHVLPGMAFFMLGLWHLFNHIKLHSSQSKSYTSFPWFPTTKSRYLELYLIVLGSSISVSMELFIGPQNHHPLDVDGTIPSIHLRNFEHSLISMSFILYATFAILLDKVRAKAQNDLTHLLGAIAFGQQLLIFHLHSADHKGLEGQYHMLLEVVVAVSLATTLMGIGLPRSFLVSFVRSLSILFQGAWFMVMGFMLWTPRLIPKGCTLHNDDGHKVVRCSSEEALHRAKSLVNIEFSWFVIGINIFAMCIYLALVERYSKNTVEYSSLAKDFEETVQEDSGNIESPKKNKMGHSKTSIPVEKSFATFGMEGQLEK